MPSAFQEKFMSALPSAVPAPDAAQSPMYNPTEGDAKRPDWAALLHEALTQPGLLSDAYRQFHRYSAGNAMLIALQAMSRGLPLGPVASFKAWLNKGYAVKKGEKALAMVMPVTVTAKAADPEEDSAESSSPRSEKASASKGGAKGGSKRTIFMFRRNWFIFSQVEPGEDAQPLEIAQTPEWSLERASEALGIVLLPFDMADGNCQGYACEDGIAVNPLARFPVKTAAHEMAHVLLGHVNGDVIIDHEKLPRSKKEAEAESVAFIVAASLGQSEEALSSARAYIQGYLGVRGTTGSPEVEEFKKKSASRIFSVADKILRAGQPPAAREDAASDSEHPTTEA
jgi:antirestriction protein ArdC